jgi:hypothetical protein
MENRVVAVYNVWADAIEILPFSLKNILPLVDHVIIVWSEASNYGEVIKNYLYEAIPRDEKITLVNWEPDLNQPAQTNELNKRNFGLLHAKLMGFTHFLAIDSDEFYVPDEFKSAKERIYKENLSGLVCPLEVYFGSPQLSAGLDVTLVPFIHKITPTLQHQFNRRYPFAWQGPQIRIDPTRSLNINGGVVLSDEIVMHHYSWVRKDYNLKIRNSSARANIERSNVLTELGNSKEGYYCEFYRKTLSRATVDFGICV